MPSQGEFTNVLIEESKGEDSENMDDDTYSKVIVAEFEEHDI